MPSRTDSPRLGARAALREIARALSAAWDLDSTLDLIARRTTDVMIVDSCTIYLLDPDGETLRLRATTGLSHRALGRATLMVGDGMTGYAVQRNEPVSAADAQQDPHFQWVDEADETAFQSLLAVPLVIEARPIGALNVQTIEPHSFDQDDIELLSLIGDLAASALSKAQLYDSQKRQLNELRALAQVSEAVTSPQYLDDILDVVTEMAAKTMDAAVCSIFLLDESGSRLELRTAQRATSAYRHRAPIAIGEGIVGSVASKGEHATIRDVRTNSRYKNPDLASDEGLVSLLCVPLSVGERVIGVFNCYTDSERDFTNDQVTIFSTLANQTALAIENARLVTNAAVVREMHHRIKNNLQTVAMLMQLQLTGSGTLDARKLVQASVHRIRSIATVHDVLSERGFRLVDVRNVLEKVGRMTVETLLAPGQNIDIRVTGEALMLPAREATSLTLVVNELVQNAIEHGLDGRTRGEIQVSLGHAPEEFVILVSDDGSGLPVEHSRGMGLEIIETLVRDDLRGRLRFRRKQTGTEVSLRIPRLVEDPWDK